MTLTVEQEKLILDSLYSYRWVFIKNVEKDPRIKVSLDKIQSLIGALEADVRDADERG